MNVLLLSMPDSFEHMPPVAIRMPNGALTSLAGNVDPHHRVAVADLILVQGRVLATVERLLAEHEPDVVGLSVMTFQRRTALRLIERIRRLRPSASRRRRRLRSEPRAGRLRAATVDFIVRGEGEITFRELLRALERGGGFDGIAGLGYRDGDGVPPHARPAGQLARRGRHRAAAPRRPRARRLHAARPAGRRRRNLARLHLRLQLLLDHRDARPQLPHLRLRPRARRHPRLPRPRRPGHLHRRRQHHARREALRGAVPGDRRRRAARRSTTRSRR